MIVLIRRSILLLWIFCLTVQIVFSQDHKTRNNYTGAWETPASWDPIWPVPITTVDNLDISINGYITANSSLSFSGSSSKLIVDDTLVIKGNLTINNNNDVQVNNNGILIVWGDLTISEYSKIEAKNYIIVTGNIIKLGSTNHGELSSDDDPVKVFVGGTISPTSLTNNKPNFPALNCTAPTTTPYPNSDCSYGNMTDILNDPISSFFQSTCTTTTPTITAGGPTTFCAGGSVTLTSSPGTTYLWSNGVTTQSINITTAGNFTVRVKNAIGCQSAASVATIVTVNALPATPTITAGGPTTFCDGGSVTLTSSSGTNYLWSNGATTSGINVTTAGSYSVRVKNANGCQSAPSVATIITVNALPATPTITAAGPTAFCESGSVTLSSSAGSTYLWSNGATTPGINVTTAGNYTVQVTNASGCQSASSVAALVTVNALPVTPTITAGGPVTFCDGGNVILTSSAETNYLWSNGAASPAINVTTPGSYSVQVINSNGCQSAASSTTVVTIDALPARPIITAGGPTTFCDGGSVTLTSGAGTNYLWSTGATTASIDVTITGSYSVQVTNASGCQSVPSVAAAVTVNALPVTPTITAGGPTTLCTGGSVALTSSPGSTYLWSDAETTESINISTAGSYTVQVTDINGCRSAVSAATEVSINALPVVNAGTDTTIPNGTSTTINATVTGTGPFTYSWSPSGQLVNALIEDPTTVNLSTTTVFTLTATSAATSCSNTSTVTITISGGPLSSTPVAEPSAVCTGENVQLHAIASGGSGTYTYIWTSLPVGFVSLVGNPVAYPVVSTTYSVAVFDGFSTVISQVGVTVNAFPATPNIIADGPTTFCAGGSVILTSSAGTSYLWSNGATTQSINVSSSGSYTVKVTNVNGCLSAASAATIVNVNSLPVTPAITSGGPTTFCAGASVTLTSSAGTSYLWSTGATSPGINVITTGSYSVQITNANGCTSAPSATTIVTVNALPATPTISAGGPTTFCAGGNVILTSVSGTDYLWSTGATTQSINVTSSGSHTVKVTNLDGCLSASSIATLVTVNALPATPIISAGGPTTFCDGGSVTLSSSAGSTYLWSNGATTPGINVSTTGSYSVRVTNASGCQSAPSVATIVTVNALPATPTITAAGPTTFCEGSSVTLSSSAGSTYLWSNGATTPDINVSTTGSYSVSVTNASGCQSAPSVATIVTVNALPATPTITAGGPVTFCDGGNVILTSSAETNYLWSNGAISPAINVTTPGSYSVQVINSNGCQSAASSATAVTVNALPARPVITAGGPTTFCAGGSVTLTSGAGTNYLWSTGATTASINVTTTDSYSVQVTNASGCQSVPSVAATVTVNALPVTPTITAGGPTTFCDGSGVILTSSAETGYLWSSGATTPGINVTTAGSYSVRVTNASGCQSASSVAIVVTVNALPATPTISANGPATFCAGRSVHLTSSPETSFKWSTGATTASIIVTTTGNYTVQVTNVNGCISAPSAATIITVNTLPATPTISAGGPTTFCAGGNVTLTSGSGTSYLWSNGAITQVINVATTGNYTVLVTNTNGCQSTSSSPSVVIVNEKPVSFAGPDQELKFVFETQMNASLSLSESGEWSLISGSGHLSDIHSPSTAVTELSIGENIFFWKVLIGNCEDGAEVKITVYDLFVPSVITPDGDGINDYFKISEFGGKVELIIFNRWGNEEYTNSNYLNDWNGRNNKNLELSNDTYFYVLKFDNGMVRKGSVLIKR